MRRCALAIAFAVLAACGGEQKKDPSIYELNRDPISVRGWILDVAGAKHGETMEMEVARRAQLFQSASLWVENAQYASGGIAENGAFVILDVPSPAATIGFNAPGAETAQVVLKNIPANADVLIPNIILERGGAKVLDPSQIVVRIPARVDKPKPTGKNAMVAGYTVPIVETPLGQFTDRRDYPPVPGFRPVATFK